MRLIVGLGNPGTEYELTRHNLGFMVVEKLAATAGVVIKRRDCRALVGQTEVEQTRVMLVKPQTYMNLSGESVACLVAKLNEAVVSRDLLVIADDLALPFGTIRLRASGSAGGHNGLKSIISCCKTQDFMRLRIGIAPEHQLGDTKSFVLDRFPRSQIAELDEIVARSAAAVGCVLRDGIERAMAQYN